jgi:hypothetical protein
MRINVTNIHEFKGMNADDMKVAYKRLVKKLHPDVNKSDTATRDMQILNAEFAYWYAISARDFVYASKVAEKPDSKSYYDKTYQNDQYIHDLSEAIAWLLNNGIFTRADLVVELVGTFIWITGIEKENKVDQALVKSRDFHFKMKWDETLQERIAAWYYTPNWRPVNSDAGMNAMRNKYGSQKVYSDKYSIGN